MEATFNLVNDGLIILNSTGIVTKINKSAEILMNSKEQLTVGKHASELLTPYNSHLFNIVKE